jgi:hypothetical protein
LTLLLSFFKFVLFYFSNVFNNPIIYLQKPIRPYSQYEAIASHIWRCACKARAGDDRQPTRVRIAVDVRNRMKPPLPRRYFGNAVFITVTLTCLYGELLSIGFQSTVSAIQPHISKHSQHSLETQESLKSLPSKPVAKPT